MSEVILFEQRERPPRAREGGTAEILFFTGVRYQRMSDGAPGEAGGGRPSSAGGVGGKRKRKRG